MKTGIDPLLGKLLDGRYEIVEMVARGGMAMVYRGMDTRLDREVAIKVMHSHLVSDDDFVERFRAEAIHAAKLSHPNLVSVYDQGRDGDVVYLVMEYLPSITLRDRLKGRLRLSPRESIVILDAILSALAVVHASGIIHRDLKPDNILLGRDGQIKLADFGLARAISTSTTTNTLIGTVGYVAPELVTRSETDTRSDLYTVGIMFYEMLTGTPPYTDDMPIQVAYRHVHDTVPPPSEAVSYLSPKLDALVLWATSKDPDDRPGDADALRLALLDARTELPDSDLDFGPSLLPEMRGLGPVDEDEVDRAKAEREKYTDSPVVFHDRDADEALPAQAPARKAKPPRRKLGVTRTAVIPDSAEAAAVRTGVRGPSGPAPAGTASHEAALAAAAPEDAAKAPSRNAPAVTHRPAAVGEGLSDADQPTLRAPEDLEAAPTDPEEAGLVADGSGEMDDASSDAQVSDAAVASAGESADSPAASDETPAQAPAADRMRALRARMASAAGAVRAAGNRGMTRLRAIEGRDAAHSNSFNAGPSATDSGPIRHDSGPVLVGAGAPIGWESLESAEATGPVDRATPRNRVGGKDRTPGDDRTARRGAGGIGLREAGSKASAAIMGPGTPSPIDVPTGGASVDLDSEGPSDPDRFNRADESPRPRRRAGLVATVAAACILLLASWFFVSGPGAYREMPANVAGQDVGDVEQSLDSLGLNVTTAETFDDMIPAGKVVGTEPGAGEQVSRGDEVTVLLSKGPELFKVPDVVGSTREDATTEITKSNLSVGEIEEEYSETVKKGEVISQSVEAGAEHKGGTTVGLVVSQGREPIEVPTVTGLDYSTASGTLGREGFLVAREDAFSDDVPRGKVISQTPSAGKERYQRDLVTLTVSKGPESVDVPNVEGQSIDEATSALEAAGFKVSVDQPDEDKDKVTSQSPGSGDQAAPGSTVTIKAD